MIEFIEEQRQKLKLTSSDNTFLEAAAFSVIEGEEADEEGDVIPELTADFEKVGLAPVETTDSDEPVDVEDADTEEEAVGRRRGGRCRSPPRTSTTTPPASRTSTPASRTRSRPSRMSLTRSSLALLALLASGCV
jgi:hypothetical protein